MKFRIVLCIFSLSSTSTLVSAEQKQVRRVLEIDNEVRHVGTPGRITGLLPSDAVTDHDGSSSKNMHVAAEAQETAMMTFDQHVTTPGSHRDLADECPSSFTINPDTGYPNYSCSAFDCECSAATGDATVKEDLSVHLSGAPTCYRCSKPDGTACGSDYECLLDSICNTSGICEGTSAGNGQCPRTATVSNTGIATSMCDRDADCECSASGDYTVKEDITLDGCFHCSKPNGASCIEDHECLYFSSTCNDDGICGPIQCPNNATVNATTGMTTSECTWLACECSEGDYTVIEDILNNNCYHCAKPDGTSCVEDHECITGSSCVDGICGDAPDPQCTNTVNIVNGTPTYECEVFGCQCSEAGYTLKEDISGTSDGVPVACNRCAKTDGSTCSDSFECSISSSCDGNICVSKTGGGGGDVSTPPPTTGDGQCPNSSRLDSSTGMVISLCDDESSGPCECTSGEYTVKEDITGSGCYHCSKPNGSSCTADDECLYGTSSECVDGICDQLRCSNISTGFCTPYECICDAPLTKSTHTVRGITCYACS